jgi:hypothetical protein
MGYGLAVVAQKFEGKFVETFGQPAQRTLPFISDEAPGRSVGNTQL